ITNYPGSHATVTQIWEDIQKSISVDVTHLMTFARDMPGLNELNTNDFTRILNNRVFDFYIIYNYPLFYKNESYTMTINGFQYSRHFMNQIIGKKTTDALHEFSAKLHTLNITQVEHSLIIPIILGLADEKIVDSESVYFIKYCFMYALYIQLCTTRTEDEAKFVFEQILQLVDSIETINKLCKENIGALVLDKTLSQKVRSIPTVIGAYSSLCALCATLCCCAIVLVVSLIPLYLNNSTGQGLGEFYCLNNYSLQVGFQIPEYNTTFTDTVTRAAYTFSTNTVSLPSVIGSCVATNCQARTSESITVSDLCAFQVKSLISPAIPNAKVFNSYALSEACYRTLQSCHYDSLLTSCLLSNCVVVGLSSASSSVSSPLTYYFLSCTTNIYYQTRCMDAGPNDRLYYSSSQQNSGCRQQRLDQINKCLNSTIALLNVPSAISVSSGLVTATTGSCTQTVASSSSQLNINSNLTPATTGSVPFAWTPTSTSVTSSTTFQSAAFSASDQNDGHAYRITSVNSAVYSTTQVGARYCGAITRAQIASAINDVISSQSS
ncbi:unnamed protein product, partial [Adineta ricciae]